MQEKTADVATGCGNSERISGVSSLPSSNGGADGIRTHDLLDAIEARSQLRHGPTVNRFLVYHMLSYILGDPCSRNRVRVIRQTAILGCSIRRLSGDPSFSNRRGLT